MKKRPKRYRADTHGTTKHDVHVDTGGLVVSAFDDDPVPESVAAVTVAGDGVIAQKETETPLSTPGYGKQIWTPTSELRGIDGSGREHLIHGDAFGNISRHGAAAVDVPIPEQASLVQIDVFDVVGQGDDLGNVVGSALTNDLTVNVAGRYSIGWHGSFTVAGGASQEMMLSPGIKLATPKLVATASDTEAIVLTSVAHGLNQGDMIETVDILGNDGANGSWICVDLAVDTAALFDLQGNASIGTGAYTSGGLVTIVYPGSMAGRKDVSQSKPGMGGGGSGGLTFALSAGDKVGLYVANLDGDRDLQVLQMQIGIARVGD